MSKVEQLKKLGAKVCPDGTTITGNTISEVIASIEDNYVAPEVPTKTSDLTNDSGFITATAVPTIPSAPTAPGEYKLVVTAEGASWVALE